MPSGMMMMRAAPTRRPPPKIDMRFMYLYSTLRTYGSMPRPRVETNIAALSSTTFKISSDFIYLYILLFR